jgi:hypothetical protein
MAAGIEDAGCGKPGNTFVFEPCTLDIRYPQFSTAVAETVGKWQNRAVAGHVPDTRY